MGDSRKGNDKGLLHFAGGVLAGLAGAYLYDAIKPGRRFSPKLLRESREHPDLPATVILPGIMGSRLERPDGSAAWLNVIAARLLPVDVRKEVLRSIQDQASRAFGANPEIPRGLLESKSADDSEFVTELFELYERHAENRWNITPE